MFEGIEITWYGYIIAGFFVGAYLHSGRFHHFIHWLIIKTLHGFVWFLARTDPLYKKPKTNKPIPPEFTGKNEPQLLPEELATLLKANPDLSVAKEVNRLWRL